MKDLCNKETTHKLLPTGYSTSSGRHLWPARPHDLLIFDNIWLQVYAIIPMTQPPSNLISDARIAHNIAQPRRCCETADQKGRRCGPFTLNSRDRIFDPSMDWISGLPKDRKAQFPGSSSHRREEESMSSPGRLNWPPRSQNSYRQTLLVFNLIISINRNRTLKTPSILTVSDLFHLKLLHLPKTFNLPSLSFQ